MATGEARLLKEVARRAVALQQQQQQQEEGGGGGVEGLVEQVRRARVVMVGEASHGTRDFYEWRAQLTQWLVEEHGFEFVAVEGDWPAAQAVNRKLLGVVGGAGGGAEAEPEPEPEAVLRKAFRRWPSWMWANRETAAFLGWLRGYNRRSGRRVRFYGLDLYSLFESMDAVVAELGRVDPALAARARAHYACFDRARGGGEEEEEAHDGYMNLLATCPEGCKAQVLRVLQELRHRRLFSRPPESEEEEELLRDVVHNARVAVDAERYYRTLMFGGGGSGSSESWNVRDRHMMETLDALVRRRTPGRAVVWAHNTHVGDYRFTSMAKQGSVNLGGLARLRYGQRHVALVGLGTYAGSVVASDRWSGPVLTLPVPPAAPGSFEDILHRAAGRRLGRFYLLFGPPKGGGHGSGNHQSQRKQHRDNGSCVANDGEHEPPSDDDDNDDRGGTPEILMEWRGHRAIGVVYDPASERWGNYVPTCLARRYDAFVFFDSSQPLVPLPPPSDGFGSRDTADAHDVPETWPTGV